MKVPQRPDIWVDLFELSRFRGKRRRLYGPSQFRSVRSRSAEWGVSIDSIVIGPGCHVWLFRAEQGDGEGAWLFPGEVVEDAAHRINDEIDSLAILDSPPKPSDPGYHSYQAACRKQKPAGKPRD